MTEAKRCIRIGTRKSQLAMIQASFVKEKLESIWSHITFELCPMSTIGDAIQNVPLSETGEKSLFTKELELALLDGAVDLVVHSLKDMSTTLPEGLLLGCVMEREDPRDALVMSDRNSNLSICDLPQGSVIGTSSVRRICQLRQQFPHLQFKSIRGNLNTRLMKLDSEDGEFDGIILACAALKRMGWSHRISHLFDPCLFLYAVGQGALGIETRKEEDILALLQPLEHLETRIVCEAERACMRTLQGGCSVPIGICSSLLQGEFTLEAQVSSTIDSFFIRKKLKRQVASVEDAVQLGMDLAMMLLDSGAKDLLKHKWK